MAPALCVAASGSEQMPCYSPLRGYRAKSINESGKRSVVFNRAEGYHDLPVTIPCGQCIGCRLERSRQWAIRCVHEAQLHDENCFITLTYNEASLPPGGSLIKKDFQDFMKRLRAAHTGRRIRYFHCGEYGELNTRPHYHACVFGFAFEDKQLWQVREDIPLYISKKLQSLWTLGFSTIGDVTFESAAYVARYITKKITGKTAPDHYQDRLPEYVTMSRRPGIAAEWYEKYKDEVFPSDTVVVRGKQMKPPKYYAQRYELANQPGADALSKERAQYAIKHKKDNTPERLRTRELVKQTQIRSLKRTYEANK